MLLASTTLNFWALAVVTPLGAEAAQVPVLSTPALSNGTNALEYFGPIGGGDIDTEHSLQEPPLQAQSLGLRGKPIFTPTADRTKGGNDGDQHGFDTPWNPQCEMKLVDGLLAAKEAGLETALTDLAHRIPKTIIQTYYTRNFPSSSGHEDRLQDYTETWGRLNPTWEKHFFLDKDMSAFMRSHFDDLTNRVFESLPFPAMKSDMFRYAALYIEGGVYTDIDTECLVPIERWASQDCMAIIGEEPNRDAFAQWTIATVPGHPLPKRALDMLVERIVQDGGVNVTKRGEHFVHWYTGPGMWTEAVADYLQLTTEVTSCALPEAGPRCGRAQCISESSVVPKLKNLGLCVMNSSFFGGTNPIAVQHWNEASWNWTHEQRARSWKIARENITTGKKGTWQMFPLIKDMPSAIEQVGGFLWNRFKNFFAPAPVEEHKSIDLLTHSMDSTKHFYPMLPADKAAHVKSSLKPIRSTTPGTVLLNRPAGLAKHIRKDRAPRK